MRRAALAIVATVTGLVLLLSFKTHSTATTASSPASISTTDAGGASGSTSSGSTNTGSTNTGSTNTAAGGTTVTGSSIDTRWGPVQVRITVSAGKLTAVQAVVYPTNNGRDQEINAYAIPELDQEALQAGNANIDMISGATYTSTGYIQSLQSALDKAGIG
jgi:uncharacterized protein with FMN-binding domain